MTGRLNSFCAAVVTTCVVGCDRGSVEGDRSVVLPPWDRGSVPPIVAAHLDRRAADVAARPRDAESWGRLGMAFDAHDLDEAAGRCYVEATTRDPESFRWCYLAGVVLSRSDSDAGAAQLERAARLRADHAPLHARLGTIALRAGDYAQAESDFARAVALDGALVVAHSGLGAARLGRGDVEGAIAALREAVARSPRSGEPWRRLAAALRRAGRGEDADAALARAGDGDLVEPLPDAIVERVGLEEGVSATWCRARALRAESAGDLERAAAHWRDATDADPGSAADARGLADVLVRLGRHDAAAAAYERAWALDDGDARTASNLAGLVIAAGQTQRGLDLLARAASLAPQDPAIHLNRASMLARVGRPDDALAALDEGLAHDPRAAALHFERAMLLARTGRLPEAAQGFLRVTSLAPERSAAWSNAARALLGAGALEDALETARHGLRIHPEATSLLELAAAALVEAGRWSEADAAIEAFERAGGDAGIVVALRARVPPR